LCSLVFVCLSFSRVEMASFDFDIDWAETATYNNVPYRTIRSDYLCNKNKTPVIQWTPVSDVESYALFIEDFFTFRDRTWYSHYYLPYISNSIRSLRISESVQKYQPPCPPNNSGVHKYKVTVYAIYHQTLCNNDNCPEFQTIKKSAEFEKVLRNHAVKFIKKRKTFIIRT